MTVAQSSTVNFLEAIECFDVRVGATSGDAWSSASPCDGWTARDVLAHCVSNLRALDAALDGEDFFTGFGQPVEGDAVEAWSSALAVIVARLDGDEVALPDKITVGGNQVPLGAMVDGLMRDIVIHSWDLARAVGSDEQLPDPLVAAATAAMAMVTDEMRAPGLYGPEQAAPANADAQARLLALSGRQP